MRVLVSGEPTFPDPTAWDRLVAQDPRGHLLQTWAWGELKGAFGWEPVRVAVERDGALVAGAQALFRRMGPLSLGYVPKGPVLLDRDEAVAEALWRAIHGLSRRRRAVALKVEPEWRDDDAAAHEALRSWGFRPSPDTIQPRRTIIVSLEADEEAILARMKPKWRYNIRLSMRKDVEVREESDALPAFYALMRVTGERDGFGIHSLDYYRRAIALFAPLDRVRLLMAYYDGEPLGGLVVYAFNRQSWYMYGASSDAHRERMPNHQLQWRAMQWAMSRGCTQYDLWGITDVNEDSPSAGLSGVERFKAGFGGEVVRYVGAYDIVYAPPLYWLMGRVWARRRGEGRAGQGPMSCLRPDRITGPALLRS